MNTETLRKYCISKAWATERFLFNEDTLAFQVGNKLFSFSNLASA